MSKWTRIIFISSLALNVILIIGFLLFRKNAAGGIHRINSLNALSNAAAARYVLQEIESEDPARIRVIKQYLRDNIELHMTEADEYRQAAKN